MTRRLGIAVLALFCSFPNAAPGSAALNLKVYAQPSHDGRISPMLYGGFVELLDDVVPGMWAEMLGDRGFEGVLPTSTWDYFRGEPNLCDRDWDKSSEWSYDTASPFNDRRSARLDIPKGGTARLSQDQLAVRKGLAYAFTGYVRGDAGAADVRISLRTRLPDETWTVLASASAGKPGASWRKVRVRLISAGTTDRAVLEIAVRGSGQVWLDQLSLMPEDNVDGWRRDVVDAMKELGPPVVRWGGSTIDPGPYRWGEAVGDRDRRPSFVNRVWGRRDTNDVGVEEFVRLCRAVGAEPLVCVSLGDGVENARRMVEYLNGPAASEWGRRRAENGRLEPYGVKYWQVGNEIDAPGYTKSLVEFARAVRAVDPGAVVLSSFPTKEIVDAAGPDIDIVCPHYYQSDLEGVDADLRRIEGWIGESAARAKLRIGVTEWNINAGNWGLGRGKLNTLGCAVFEARFLNVLHRHAGPVALACRSNMTNSFCGGTIQTNAAGLYRTPSFLVMALYRDHTRPVPLRVAADIPAALDVTACASEDQSRVTIFIVNPDNAPARVSLDLSDLGPGFAVRGGEIVKDSQDRGQIDIVNGFADPRRVVRGKLETGPGNDLTLPALSIAAIDCGAAAPAGGPVEPEVASLDRLFALREKVRDIHPLFAKLYPVAVARDKTLRIFKPNEAAKTYELATTVPEPFPIPTGIRAAFPLEALGGEPACVVTPEIFTEPDGLVFVLHEFVHCGQWTTVEPKLKETLGLYRRAMEKKDYMWELQHPFPYEDPRFVAAYGAMLAALRAGDGVRKSRAELAGFLSADDFDYMTWQEWKEGLARHLENAIRARLGLPANDGGLARPYTRVTFYAGGDRLIGFLAKSDPQVPADLAKTFEAIRSIQASVAGR